MSEEEQPDRSDAACARTVLTSIKRTLGDDAFARFCGDLASARLRRDIRASATMARKDQKYDLEQAETLSRRLLKVLEEPAGVEPNSAHARIAGYLFAEAAPIEGLLSALDIVARAAKAELAGFTGGPSRDWWGSVGDELARSLATIAHKHLGILPVFPKDIAGDYGGDLIAFIEAVQEAWGDATPMRGSAIRSAFNRAKGGRDQGG